MPCLFSWQTSKTSKRVNYYNCRRMPINFHFYFSGIFQTPLVPLSNLSAPSAAAAVIRASSSVAGPVGITTPPTTAVAGIPPLGSRPSNDPIGPMVTSTSISAARRSVSPPAASSLGMGMDKSAASAPHSPSPVGSMISKENSNSQQGGVPSPTYSQVRKFRKYLKGWNAWTDAHASWPIWIA